MKNQNLFVCCILLICFSFVHAQTNPAPCNALGNYFEWGDFDALNTLCEGVSPSDFVDGCVKGPWYASHGTPKVEDENGNFHMVLEANYQSPDFLGEGVFYDFTYQNLMLEAGKVYRLRARISSNQLQHGTLSIEACNGLMAGGLPGIGSAGYQLQPWVSANDQQLIFKESGPNLGNYALGEWTQLDIYFVPREDFSQIRFFNFPQSFPVTQPAPNSEIRVDDLCLIEQECTYTAGSLGGQYELICVNQGADIEIKSIDPLQFLTLYNTNGLCDILDMQFPCLSTPPIGHGDSFTRPYQVGAEYVIEIPSSTGCPTRDLIRLEPPSEIDLASLKGDICLSAANIDIPAGIASYEATVTSLDPQGNVIVHCEFDETDFPAPAYVNLFDACPGLACGTGEIFKTSITYTNECGPEIETVKSTFLCSPEVSVTVNPNPVCDGGQALFVGTLPASGTSFWYKNGIPVSNGPFYTTTVFASDHILVEHLAPNGCRTSYKPFYLVELCSSGRPRRLGGDNQAFQLYPNPADKVLHIKYPAGIQGKASLTDLTGRNVWQQDLSTEETSCRIMTNTMSRGIYLFQVQDAGQGIFRQKVVIQH